MRRHLPQVRPFHGRVSIHAPTRGATALRSLCSVLAEVSIHAPTRGATGKISVGSQDEKVSIHAPTRGATHWHILLFHNSSFNPRTHEGCDLPTFADLLSYICFNPRTHEGCDGLDAFCTYWLTVSIHAPTRGATLIDSTDRPVVIEFQSTHPRGVRLYLLLVSCSDDDVSIHAPTRGATKYH